jgi:hypothetical protein
MGKANIRAAGIETHDMLLKTRFQVPQEEVCWFSPPVRATSRTRINPHLQNIDHIV